MGKSRVQHLSQPPRDRVKLFLSPILKGWKRCVPPPSAWLKLSMLHLICQRNNIHDYCLFEAKKDTATPNNRMDSMDYPLSYK